MIRLLKRSLGIASVALLANFVASAANATVFIGESTDGGSITQVGTGTNSASVSGGTYGNFTASVVGNSTPPDYLFSNAIGAATSTGGTLTLYITATGLTQSAEQLFLSGFSSNNLLAGFSVTEQTFLDTGNGGNNVFSTSGTLLGSQTFTSFGAVQQTANLGAIAGPFSITEVYTITATGPGTFNATIDVSAVPEASTWAMLILGFLGVGFTAYRKKMSFRFA